MTNKPLLKLERVTIGYRSTALIDQIDCAVFPGDFLGLVGPNGAGKSTLLKTILGIIKPIAGRIEKRRGLRFGYVPQRTGMDPIYPLTALEIARSGGLGSSLPAQRRHRLASATRAEGLGALEQLGVAGLARSPFRDLSGGQQQRVLIARALVRSPDILILDEPTAGLDIPSENDLLEFITDLSRLKKTTIVLVAHQISIVAGRASRMALINKDLPLFAVGPADEFLSNERLTELYRYPMEVE